MPDACGVACSAARGGKGLWSGVLGEGVVAGATPDLSGVTFSAVLFAVVSVYP